jgi:hypothetical protein
LIALARNGLILPVGLELKSCRWSPHCATDLMKRRAEVAAKLKTAETAWLEISEELETVEA